MTSYEFHFVYFYRMLKFRWIEEICSFGCCIGGRNLSVLTHNVTSYTPFIFDVILYLVLVPWNATLRLLFRFLHIAIFWEYLYQVPAVNLLFNVSCFMQISSLWCSFYLIAHIAELHRSNTTSWISTVVYVKHFKVVWHNNRN